MVFLHAVQEGLVGGVAMGTGGGSCWAYVLSSRWMRGVVSGLIR